MTTCAVPATLPLERVTTTALLGAGGQGRVLAVGAVAGVAYTGDLILKTYQRPEELDGRALAHAVVWRRSLPDDDRRALDEICAWPWAVVTDGDWPSGALMPRVGSEFAEEMVLPSGKASTVLREAQFLMASRPMLEARGLDSPTPESRRAALSALARAVQTLHGLGVVLGDVSPKNVLWRSDPSAVYLLDCDAMRLVGCEPPLRAVDSPGWRDPAFAFGQSQATDMYKFALFVVRVMSQRFQETDPEAAASLGDAVCGLARDSLSPDPDRRPTATQWAIALA